MPSSGPLSTSPLSKPPILVPWQFRVHPVLVSCAGLITTILLATGLLVAARRLLGSIQAELAPSVMLVTALVTATIVAFMRVAWRRNFPLETSEDLSTLDQLLGWCSSAALLFLAIGCCYPANHTTDWLIWLPILVADQLWRQTFFDAGEPWVPHAETFIDDKLGNSPTLLLADTSQVSCLLPNDMVQQIYRMQGDAGCEIIYGTLRADFVAGQRTAVVHAGFCPPLSYLPEIEAEAIPGFEAKLKVVQSMAHGTRLDVRLPAPATEDCQVWIDMAARPAGAVEPAKIA